MRNMSMQTIKKIIAVSVSLSATFGCKARSESGSTKSGAASPSTCPSDKVVNEQINQLKVKLDLLKANHPDLESRAKADFGRIWMLNEPDSPESQAVDISSQIITLKAEQASCLADHSGESSAAERPASLGLSGNDAITKYTSLTVNVPSGIGALMLESDPHTDDSWRLPFVDLVFPWNAYFWNFAGKTRLKIWQQSWKNAPLTISSGTYPATISFQSCGSRPHYQFNIKFTADGKAYSLESYRECYLFPLTPSISQSQLDEFFGWNDPSFDRKMLFKVNAKASTPTSKGK